MISTSYSFRIASHLNRSQARILCATSLTWTALKILLDCGWNDSFDVNLLEPLAKVAAEVDAVLISHPDTEHLGALPYAFGKLGMRCKVYATLPVHKMGLMFMYDHFLRNANEDFGVFTLDDIDTAFSAFVPVRYAQRSALVGHGAGITITPYAAGHMLGVRFGRFTKKQTRLFTLLISTIEGKNT